MTAPTFVRLKSGGPIMTILSADRGNYLCQWFFGPEPYEMEFPEAALHMVTLSDMPASPGRVVKLREADNG